jgi:Tol biopolymer transport system component
MADDTHADIRRLLVDLGETIPDVVPQPERTVRHARRRAGVTLAGGSVLAIALIAALVVGVSALPEREHGVVGPAPPSDRGVYIFDLGAGALTPIEGLPEDAHAVDVAPDGTRLAFVSGLDGPPQIYVANLDGSGVERVTSDPVEAREPAWSPEGDQIAYVGYGPDTPGLDHRELYVVDPTTRITVAVEGAQDDPHEPEWSPDGDRIAYLVLEQFPDFDHNALFVHDLATDRSTRLALPARELPAGGPAWSDGSLAYPASVDGGDIDILQRAPDATGPGTKLFTGPSEDLAPAYSPNGSLLAFSSEGAAGMSVKVVDGADGRLLHALRRVTTPTWLDDDRVLVEAVPPPGAS